MTLFLFSLEGVEAHVVSPVFKHTFLLIQRNLSHYVSARYKEHAGRLSFLFKLRRTLL